MVLAPVILFTYNRPTHTRITLEHLRENILSSQSTLYVYCDGSKPDASEETIQKIREVKNVVRSEKWASEVIVIEAQTNKGLAQNIIDGVTEVTNRHGKAIVLEDDLMVGKHFLSFMNEALEKYEHSERVKQVSGFLFPLGLKANNGSLFLPVTNTIGWGTWKREWSEIDFNAKGYETLKTDKELQHRFNLDGSYNYSKMMISQMESKNYGSWGIRYYWSVFNKNGLVLYPDYPMIQHNDFDSSGTHLSDYKHYDQPNWNSNYTIQSLNNSIEIDARAYSIFKKYIKIHNRITIKKIATKFKQRLKKSLF